MTAILASKELAQKVMAIDVSRETSESEIAYMDPSNAGSISWSKFGPAGRPEEHGMRLRASLSGHALNQMVNWFDKGEARP